MIAEGELSSKAFLRLLTLTLDLLVDPEETPEHFQARLEAVEACRRLREAEKGL